MTRTQKETLRVAHIALWEACRHLASYACPLDLGQCIYAEEELKDEEALFPCEEPGAREDMAAECWFKDLLKWASQEVEQSWDKMSVAAQILTLARERKGGEE